MTAVKTVKRKSLIIRPSGRSSDFISPSFGHGCLLNCSYCYMKRHKYTGLSIANNPEHILTEINSHAMQEQVVQRKVKEQEAMRAQREEQSRQYADNVYNTLAEGKLGDLTINNKVQNLLYQGLIQPNYQSVSGQPTNLFGHLIEKHQYVEPNHGLIAEALWLLADPDGYRSEIKKGTK